eukprot:5254931-Pleurochrysis_carterae.AAC.1
MGAALASLKADNMTPQNQLQALLALVPDVDDETQRRALLCERVREKLCEGARSFTSQLVDHLLSLQAKSAYCIESSDGSDNKFATGEASFELSYASLSDFHNGLEGLIGTPSVHFMVAMEEEHTRPHELNTEFTTGNYGITTTPRIDWHFVAGRPEKVVDFLESIGGEWPRETRGLEDESHRRKRVPLEELLIVAAKLNEKLK